MRILFGIIFAIISYAGLIYLGLFIWRNYVKPIKIEDIESSNEFFSEEIIKFKDIKRGMLIKDDYEYVSYIEVPSLNIGLMNEMEVLSVEKMNARLINKLNFPIVYHIQTTPLDNESIVDETKRRYFEMTNIFPKLQEYGDQYISELSRLNHHMKRTTHKTKYILIPYKVENPKNFDSDEEMENHAFEVLEERTAQIIGDIQGMKMNAKKLWDYEIIKLLYISIQRDFALFKELVAKGEFETRMVKNNRSVDVMPNESLELTLDEALNKIELALYEAQLKIKNTGENSQLGNRQLIHHKSIIKELMKIQSEVIKIRENEKPDR